MSDVTGTRSESRVERWVTALREDGSEFEQALAANFQYYIDHIDAFEDGSFDFQNLPEFSDEECAAIHAAVKFGLSWAYDSTLYTVVTAEGEYVDLFGIQENAARIAAETDGYEVKPLTPTGQTPRDAVASMQAGTADILVKTGDCMEHLLDNEDTLQNDDSQTVIEGMPHFDTPTNTALLYSALFGRLWEYSEPGLWIALTENNIPTGLYTSPTRAAEAAQEDPELTIEPVTPRDNDRQATPTAIGEDSPIEHPADAPGQ